MGKVIFNIMLDQSHKRCKHHKENAYEEFKSENEHYEEYIEKYGYHFTDKLAELAISEMVTTSGGGKAKWTIAEVVAAVKAEHPTLDFVHEVTHGDLAYAANMYYADFYPSAMTEADCIKAAVNIADDVDGYEGQIFCRWLTDVMMKRKDVDWKHYL